MYSSPLRNTLELAKCLPQEGVAPCMIRGVCILLLDRRPSRRLGGGTDLSSVTHSASATNKIGDPTISLILTSSRDLSDQISLSYLLVLRINFKVS